MQVCDTSEVSLDMACIIVVVADFLSKIQTAKVFSVYRIHPRYKQDVAERLVLGALHVAFGRTDVTFQGPFPTGIRANVNTHHTLDIQYNHGHVELTVKNTHVYEVSKHGA